MDNQYKVSSNTQKVTALLVEEKNLREGGTFNPSLIRAPPSTRHSSAVVAILNVHSHAQRFVVCSYK